MDDFCANSINCILHANNEIDIISFILRDIFTNDIIYVDTTCEWKQYVRNDKKWDTFIDLDLFQKIKKLDTLFSNVLVHYIKKYEDNQENTLKLLLKLNELNEYVKHIDEDKFKQIVLRCQKLFTINSTL